MLFFALLLYFCLCDPVVSSDPVVSNREFYVDWENDRFVKDGATYQYASGGMHYFRIPYQYWTDRIYSAKSAGLNTIETYVIWNLHEPSPGQYTFSEHLNLIGFIEEVHKQNMSLILRVGPYICAEQNFGGIPPWLWSNPDIKVRTQDPAYLDAVHSWLTVLLPKIKPYLYDVGGPIIMIQVENEYGSFGCDHVYMGILRDMFRTLLGDDVVLFTTDGKRDWELRCGITPGLFGTVDFSPEDNMTDIITRFRKHQKHGPIVNSELYAGWCDYWKIPHAKTAAGPLGTALDKLLGGGASVNLYMWHGGTNYGLTTGGELNKRGTAHAGPTSYDYDAPVSEWGDIKAGKYWTIRNVTHAHFPGNTLPAPPPSAKLSGKTVPLSPRCLLTDQITNKRFLLTSLYPKKMEELGLYEGMVAYVHMLLYDPVWRANVVVRGVHDRAYFLVDGRLKQVIKRDETASFTITGNSDITILVENFGYIGFGVDMANYTCQYKGMLNVTLDDVPVTIWAHYNISVRDPVVEDAYYSPSYWLNLVQFVEEDSYLNTGEESKVLLPRGPVVYSGTLELKKQELLDTFLDTTGWSKGYLIVNGRMIGRYWPDAGPQYTLYIPGVYLTEGTNTIMLLELQSAADRHTVTLTNTPNIGGPVNPHA